MPSKYEKERLKAKKEAAKQKGGKKATAAKDDAEAAPATNGASSSNGASKESTPAVNDGVPLTYEEELCKKLEEEARSSSAILQPISYLSLLYYQL